MTDNPEVVWALPEPVSVHEVQVDAGTRVFLRRHGNPDGPRLVLSHGNGLAIDLYYPFWSLLAGDFDLVVYDLRSHGWNDVSALERHNVPTLVSDHDSILDAVDRHYGEKPQVGVFHSVAALVSLLSPIRGGRYSALVLFDPPLCKPGRSHREFEAACRARRRIHAPPDGAVPQARRVFRGAAVPAAVPASRARCLRPDGQDDPSPSPGTARATSCAVPASTRPG